MPEGYQISDEGVCGLTHTVAGGPFVTGPYMITQAYVGSSLTLAATTIRAYAEMIGLVEASEFDEILDQKDARIADLQSANEALEEELKMTRPAAQRYFIETGQVDGTTWEQRHADDQERIAKLEKQLQQLNRGGRPKKEAVA